ncbi:MAG: helix-turn-helix domain-containing protein, partial [Okeania sp. SIO2D1]|nr:helix-turn-helix domain-containing protein [Okeania sp. SIO2D1]
CSELCEEVFGNWYGIEKVCDVHISNIRKKFKNCGCDFEYIKTIYNVGYKFEAPK